MKSVLAEKKKGDGEGRGVFRLEDRGGEGMKLSWVCEFVGVRDWKL